MKLVLLPFLLLNILSSCNLNRECSNKEALLGIYSINYGLLAEYNNNDTSLFLLVKKKGWNTIELVIEYDTYYFRNCDDFFRNYNGSWKYKQIGLDGDCYILMEPIKKLRDIAISSFSIAIEVDGITVVLPFQKKGNL